jgi:hypothetical protein
MSTYINPKFTATYKGRDFFSAKLVPNEQRFLDGPEAVFEIPETVRP